MNWEKVIAVLRQRADDYKAIRYDAGYGTSARVFVIEAIADALAEGLKQV